MRTKNVLRVLCGGVGNAAIYMAKRKLYEPPGSE